LVTLILESTMRYLNSSKKIYLSEILEKRKAEADRRFERMMSSFSRYIDPLMSFPYSFERYFK